jgi:hypothetical protein
LFGKFFLRQTFGFPEFGYPFTQIWLIHDFSIFEQDYE